MAGRLIPRLFDVVIDANGAPISGALMTTYVNNTTTLKTTWTTSALNVAHTNPIVADSAGRFPDIWGVEGETYRVKITNASGVLIYQSDDIIILGANPSGTIDRDFGADGRFQIYASGGVASFEGGDASPDNTGGKVRIGGWNATQADTLELDAAATTIDGTASVAGNATVGGTLGVTGNATFGGSITLSDGSRLVNTGAPVVVSGRLYYADTILAPLGAGAATTKDQIYWLPFSRAVTLNAINFYTVFGSAGADARVGVYSSNATTGLPETRLSASNAISMATSGLKTFSVSPSITVSERVWLAIVASDNLATLRTNFDATGCDGSVLGATSLNVGDTVLALYSTFAYAALPATAPAITGVIKSDVPILAVTAA